MKNIKCPLVALNRVRDIAFEPIERALSVTSYAVLSSNTIISELCRF